MLACILQCYTMPFSGAKMRCNVNVYDYIVSLRMYLEFTCMDENKSYNWYILSVKLPTLDKYKYKIK